jgi:Tfp pilus assembly protein PilV
MTRRDLAGQAGTSLLEAVVTLLVVGTALIGLTLMLSRGQTFVAQQGDTRVALYLAQQKIERLSGLGFSAAKVESNGKLNYSDANANSGCDDPTANNEPCYNETLAPATGTGAGIGQQTPSLTHVDTQMFTRLTCVRWVQDDNPELPADVLEPPASWTCPSCDATQANCTKKTKRVKVAVIPKVLGNPDTATPVDPTRVTLEVVLTQTAQP